jgi:hypothetical protein
MHTSIPVRFIETERECVIITEKYPSASIALVGSPCDLAITYFLHIRIQTKRVSDYRAKHVARQKIFYWLIIPDNDARREERNAL